jgi:diaminopimelate decarboxylase
MNFDYLDLAKTHFEQAPDGTLRVTLEGVKCAMGVEARCAFALTYPEDHIVLRDGADKEVGVIQSLAQVPQPAQKWLRIQLERRYFLPQVTAIYGIVERFGSSVWDLDTDRGRVVVSTRQMHEALQEIEPGRFLITDAENNRYEIRNIKALDEKSRARFIGKY